MSDPFVIAGRPFQSRLIVGTGKYPSHEVMRAAHEASGAEMVTVAVRRVDITRKSESLLDYIDTSRIFLLPNTAACYTAEELGSRLRVSTKTICRWRRRGLVGRKLRFPDNTVRMAFLEPCVRRFISRNLDLVKRGAAFKQLSASEKQQIVTLARETLAVRRVRLHELSQMIAARMNRAVVPHMRKQARGLLIYMSSGGGRTILPFLGAYSASKFALEALAESYHYQLYSLGIDTVIVQPGAHATPVSTNSRSASEADRGAGYGPVATQMDQAIARFHAFFAGGGAPAPKAVIDAVMPGRWAAPPAPAMITFSPRPLAPAA